MAENYPEDSLQALVARDSWWVKTEKKVLCAGRLVYAYVPIVDLNPRTIEPIGRSQNPADHSKALFELKALRAQDRTRRRQSNLPVAALPSLPDGVYGVYRTKRRPVIVLSDPHEALPHQVKQGGAKWQSQQFVTVAPAFGVKGDGSRQGWPPEFVRRIKDAEYPQYMWDRFPESRDEEGSIVRFDHIQPIGTGTNAFEPTPYRLGEEALILMRQWVHWCLTGRLEGPELRAVRELLMGA